MPKIVSDHSTAIVPIEAWCYSSPEIRHAGKSIDVGLLAEALIYYDHVLVQPTNEPQFAELIAWFVKQNRFGDLVSLIQDGTINFYCYAFLSAPILIQETGHYTIMNVQDEEAAKSRIFEPRYLSYKNLKEILPHARQREKLARALRGRVIEVKAEEFGPAIENARKDFENPARSAFLVQALLNEVSRWLHIEAPSEVVVSTKTAPDGNLNITWNVDFAKFREAMGKNLGFHNASPLQGAIHSNRLLWSASKQRSDLYLASPMSSLVESKLVETSHHVKNPQLIVQELKGEVEFPDVRSLVNAGEVGLDDILTLRKKGSRFRKWLQEESEHNRNAILAYHTEVAKEVGWTRGARKTLRLVGVVAGAATGAVVGGAVAGIPGSVVGALAGEGLKYVMDLAASLGEGWRPVVFGNLVKESLAGRSSQEDNNK